jgi:hypothetical protein
MGGFFTRHEQVEQATPFIISEVILKLHPDESSSDESVILGFHPVRKKNPEKCTSLTRYHKPDVIPQKRMCKTQSDLEKSWVF